MIKHPVWAVVADGGRARFLIRRLPNLPFEELEQLAETADLVERRHNFHDDVGHGQRAVTARTTPHERDEQRFLRHVAGQIDRAVVENAAGALVLCAPPRALGLLRSFISENARRLVASEIDQDIVRERVSEINTRLTDHDV